MRNSIAFAVATALIACGGSVAPQNNGPTDKVEVSTDLSTIGVLPAYAHYVVLDAYTSTAGTTRHANYSGITAGNGLVYGALLSPCSPVNPILWSPTAPPTNCWDGFNAKFQAVSLNLSSPAAVKATFYETDPTAGATVPTPLAVSPIGAVTFTSGAGKVALTPAVYEPVQVAGVYITSLTSSLNAGSRKNGFTTMYVGETNTFNVTALDNSTTTLSLTYNWAVAADPTVTGSICNGTFASATVNPAVFSGIQAGDRCAFTLDVFNGSKSARRVWTISGSNSTTVSGGVLPPTITQFTLTGTGTGDVPCVITQPGGGWSGTSNTTCPQAFKLAASPLNTANWNAPQTNWGIFTVSYDVGTAGIDANNPPSVTIRTFCSNDAYVFDPALAPAGTPPAPAFKYIASGTTGGYPAGCAGTAASPCLNISAPNSGDAFWPSFGLNSYYDTTDRTPVTKLTTEPTWWPEPVIANAAYTWLDLTPLPAPARTWEFTGNGPAPLCASAPRDPVTGKANGPCTTAATTTQCAFQVIASNQGAKDAVIFFANFQ